MGRRSTWMAWAMVAVYVACLGLELPLSVANGNIQHHLSFYLTLTLAFTAFMMVGAVIVARRPGNVIGWLFSAIGLLTATGTLALEYAEYAYVTRPGTLPGALLAAWYSWWWLPLFALILVLTPLLSPPDSCCRPAGARWRCWPPPRPQRSPYWRPCGQPSSCRTRTIASPTPSGSPASPTRSKRARRRPGRRPRVPGPRRRLPALFRTLVWPQVRDRTRLLPALGGAAMALALMPFTSAVVADRGRQLGPPRRLRHGRGP